MVDVSEARGCMLKLRDGFEIKDDGRELNYVVRKGADFASRIASWLDSDAYFIMSGAVAETRHIRRGENPVEVCHALIVAHVGRYGVESPWEVVSEDGLAIFNRDLADLQSARNPHVEPTLADLRAAITRIIEARDVGTVAALIDEIESARRILRGESC